ncbi:hypothetical protein [Rubinisphaera sp.]|uniref:hypothetical protein n=1 Tax=Rubinisphaera sp. TaxID=2024857 RepID=UPI000C0CD770|nr:hypothetical protein [Rubinisphaera sp.]MBV08671.1 hypothetical protein [Rubinisphaera sp.]|tara:strand:+ start:554 stop:766 length:213 start_codon:yes stop_codon:yes gene_type:complete
MVEIGQSERADDEIHVDDSRFSKWVQPPTAASGYFFPKGLGTACEPYEADQIILQSEKSQAKANTELAPE